LALKTLNVAETIKVVDLSFESEEISDSLGSSDSFKPEKKARISLKQAFYLQPGGESMFSMSLKSSIDRACRRFANLDTPFATLYKVLCKSVDVRSNKEQTAIT
jgi:hypothetical protein